MRSRSTHHVLLNCTERSCNRWPFRQWDWMELRYFFYVCFNSHVSYEDRVGQRNEWMCVERWWNDTDVGKHRYLEKTLSHCHCVHKYHLSGLGLNWGLGGDRLAANNLRHGLAWAKVLGINSKVIQAVSCDWLSPRTMGGWKQIESSLGQYKFWA